MWASGSEPTGAIGKRTCEGSREGALVQERVCLCKGSLVPKPLERLENETSVYSAAVTVVTKCAHTVIVVSPAVKDV